MQQLLKFAFFVYLGRVIARPLLPISLFDRDRLSVGLRFAVIGVLTLNEDLSRENMVAPELPGCEVWTGAMRVRWIGLDRIGVVTTFGLRRDKPSVAVVAPL